MEQKVQNNLQDHSFKRLSNYYPYNHQSDDTFINGIKQLNKVVDSNYFSDLQSQVSASFSTTDYCVGLLRVNYNDSKGQLKYLIHATAFAVTNRLLITSTHNIYNQQIKEFASSIDFFPGATQGPASRYKSYRSTRQNFYKCQLSNSIIRVTNEVSLLVLQKELDIQQFITIGKYNKEKDSSKQVKLIGYPSKLYFGETDNRSVQVNRLYQLGNIHSDDGILINYQIKTSIGVSGSPVFIKNQNNQWIAIGIHIKRGQSQRYNTGLLFTKNIINKIKKFERNLKSIHKLSKQIIYYNQQKSNQIQLQQTKQLVFQNIYITIKFDDQISNKQDDTLQIQEIN